MSGLNWVHDPSFDSLTAKTEFGTYKCIRNYVDASILYFDNEKLGGNGGGSHDKSKLAAEKHYAALKEQ